MRIREPIGIWILELRDRLMGYPGDYEQRKGGRR